MNHFSWPYRLLLPCCQQGAAFKVIYTEHPQIKVTTLLSEYHRLVLKILNAYLCEPAHPDFE